MPELELGINPELDSMLVWATMCYPEDQEAREAFLWAQWVDYIVEYKPDNWQQIISLDTLKSLLNAPSISEIWKQVDSIITSAQVAGSVLETLYQLVELKAKEPGLDKAIYLVRNSYINNPCGDGTSLRYGESSNDNAWKKYKSVAHLWAALMMLRYNEPPQHDMMFRQDELPTFLAIAEKFRLFGETFFSSRNPENPPPLDPKMTWKVPRNYPLSMGRIKLGEMPMSMAAGLDKYKKAY